MGQASIDKLIDDIIELILGDVDCHHEVDHDEDGAHVSVEYNLNDETKLRGMIRELIEQSGRSELRSKCHGATVELMESEMPDSGFRMQRHLGYRCEKCNKPCEVEEKEEVGK